MTLRDGSLVPSGSQMSATWSRRVARCLSRQLADTLSSPSAYQRMRTGAE